MSISPSRNAHVKINGKTSCIASFQNKSVKEILSNDAICGDIDNPLWRYAPGRNIYACTMTFDFTLAQLQHFIPLLGITSAGGGVYSLGANDTLTAFPMSFDLVGSLHEWTNCYVSKYTFRGSRGSRPMQLELDIVGTSEAEGTLPLALDPLDADKVFSFTNMTCSIDSVSRQVNSILLQVDNSLVLEWNNSANLTDAVIGAREVVIATSVPYTATWDDLYWNLKTDFDGIPTTLVFTSADGSLTALAPACVGVARTGDVVSKNDQIRTPVTLLCARSLSLGNRVSPLTLTLA